MKPSPEFSSNPPHTSSLPTSAAGFQPPSKAATIVYQGVTIAAMLLLLCSLWAF
jgi:hypothetical protein